MATRTFIGDGSSHNWSATGAWAEGIVPTAADDVVFSGNTAGSILVIDGTSGSPSLCRSFDTTGYTRTITRASNKQLNIGDGTAGVYKLTAGMTYAPASDSLVKFVSTTTGNNITTAGYREGSWEFDGVGGVWTLQDSLDPVASSTITHTNGHFNVNSQAVGSSSGVKYSSSNSNVRALTMGAAIWKHSATTGTIWDITISTGMTLSAASSTITSTSLSNTPTNFHGGGLTYGSYTPTMGGDMDFYIYEANTFGTLTVTGTASKGGRLFLGANQTVTGTCTINGNSTINRTLLASDTPGTARTLSAATFSFSNIDLRDITKAGAGSGNIAAITGLSGDCGGNTGWTFTTPINCYAKTGASNNWSNVGIWFTTSGGSTPARVPLVQDFAIFDANSITAGSVSIAQNMWRACGVNFTGVTNTPALTNATSCEYYGSMTLVAGMTHTGAQSITFAGRGSFTLDGGTLTWPTSSTIIVNCATGTYTLARNLTSNDGLTTNSGTFAQGGFTLNCTALHINGGTHSGAGAVTGTTATIAGGTSTLTSVLTLTGALAVSSGTLNVSAAGITGHTTCAISGGIVNLSGQVNGSGAITISGGTINDTGTAGELKGTTMSATGGTSKLRKMTLSSTFAQSSTASITVPTGGSATWATSWTWSGTSYTFITEGPATWQAGALSVSPAGSYSF